MLSLFRRKFKLLCSRVRRFLWGRPRPKVVIRRLGKWYSEVHPKKKTTKRNNSKNAVSNIQTEQHFSNEEKPIRIATFNVAMFTLAPAISKMDESHESDQEEFTLRPTKSILKSPLNATASSPMSRSNLKVSINLPENEISLANNKLLSLMEAEKQGSISSFASQNNKGFYRSPIPVRSPLMMFSPSMPHCWNWYDDGIKSGRSILEVLREVGADILALQDVKAEEERGMKPLSDLAASLGMKYVFAESWAPEYGNAILSKWPIKKWKIQKIANNDDFRNVLKATIEVPWLGEVNVYCTQLDHLDENWRMKQIGAFSQVNDNSPHILAGGLNSLTGSDYSSERWTDIVKYYEDMGKPTPKVEVMKFLKGKGYTDAKDYAGECEPVVIIAKGQNVQGTCKYGTRVDYILSNSESPFKFMPGSYSVVSSKGTSDHHLVKVDITRVKKQSSSKHVSCAIKRHKKLLKKIVRVTSDTCSKGVWNLRP